MPITELASTVSPSRQQVRAGRGLAGPIAIYYEHPVWFERLFAELDRRGTPYVKLHAGSHFYDPADPGADFPKAPVEPAVYKQMRGPHRMLIGLANDEIGYVIPKRQWDEKPPFCYGRDKPQYGEANSVGPETAPLLCRAFQELVRGK